MRGLEDVTPRTAQEAVAERLRRDILSGRCEPGSRLAQSEIAAAMKVSITPVREALRELATEGLVDVDRFRGAIVHTPTAEELREVFAIRQRLIPMATELGVRSITARELSACELILNEMEATADDSEWSLLNRSFHRALDGASRTQHLTGILHRLDDIAMLYIRLSLGEQVARRSEAEAEHRALLHAYLDRDADTAIQLYLEHFKGTLRTAGDLLGE
ncbi:GntR family transcriptional regulator [Nocardia sp. NPDC051833]|uniref:GntR family transcriptional regulator n=1 Tax=Nocardia sp. NPDC051833 TaxID=3155674 RepID=UPI003439FA6D